MPGLNKFIEKTGSRLPTPIIDLITVNEDSIDVTVSLKFNFVNSILDDASITKTARLSPYFGPRAEGAYPAGYIVAFSSIVDYEEIRWAALTSAEDAFVTGTPDFSDGASSGDFGEPFSAEDSTEAPAEFGDSYDEGFDFSDGGGNK